MGTVGAEIERRLDLIDDIIDKEAMRFKTDGILPSALAAQARITGRIVQLPAQNAFEVEQLLATLREAGLAVEDVEMRKADLEDVFIDLMAGEQTPLEVAR
jgi:ABC-2 type transport system ATP-binding protein